MEVLRSAFAGFISEAEPRGWHRTLFRGFVPLDCYAGNYRTASGDKCLAQDVGVAGVRGSSYHTVRSDIESLFTRTCDSFAELELGWPIIAPKDRAVRLALATAFFVGYFIRIHPFLNGNGRISRLVWRWCLLRFGVPVQCLAHPRPNPPYDQIMAEAMQGNMNPLALYILDHLAQHPLSQDAAASKAIAN
jgi:fido (protein-threonine AMPylation protein)